MNADQDLVAVERTCGDVVAHLGEDGAAHGEPGGALQFEQARQDPGEATGIQQEAGADHVFLAIRRAHIDQWTLTGDIDRQHLMLEAHGGAHAPSFAREDAVEVGTYHLVGRAPAW